MAANTLFIREDVDCSVDESIDETSGESAFDGLVRRWEPLSKKYGLSSAWLPAGCEEMNLVKDILGDAERLATRDAALEPDAALAAAFLCDVHKTGLGVARSEATGLAWCRRAAEMGLAKSQHNMGVFYRDGLGGLEQDYARALEWFSRAAEGGNLSSTVCIGNAHEHGNGVPRDGTKAVDCYRKSAGLGHPIGMFNLGLVYKNGTCGEKSDFDEGVAWITKAAEMGHPSAQSLLGSMYASGEIGRGGARIPSFDEYCSAGGARGLGNLWKRNVPEAMRWWRKAAAQGDPDAAENIAMTIRMERFRSALGPIPCGARVALQDLKARPQLNGAHGVVSSFDSTSGRYAVRLDDADTLGGPFKLRPVNLRLRDFPEVMN